MNPLLLLIPVAGVVGYFIYTKSQTPGILPPPGTPAMGVRFQSYIQQINEAMLAFRTAKAFAGPSLADVKVTTGGTLDVIGSMAQVDMSSGNITASDLAMIQAQIAAGKKEIG